MTVSIIVNAATGRMGKALLTSIVSDAATTIAAALARNNHPLIETDVGYLIGANPQSILLSTDLSAALSNADVLVDFSLPDHSMATLEQALSAKTPMVIGTTGFNESQLATIKQAAQSIPVMLASNYSLGVNSLIHLVTEASRVLGEQADIEIFEAHHKHKIDSPSGTALSIGEAVADVKGQHLQDIMTTERQGKRKTGDIGFSVMRAGEIIGTHEVTFALNGELLSIKHEAQSRQCFADGAIVAAKWLIKQSNGLYSIQDMLKNR